MTYTWTTEFPHPRRYGIIPCRRCAFWVSSPPDKNPRGYCQRHAPPPKTGGSEAVEWPITYDSEGCGDGLLREEAAPLPPEQQETKP